LLKSLHRSLECITLAKEFNKLKHNTMTNQIKLTQTLNKNPKLLKLVKGLQTLNSEGLDMNKVITDLKLPLGTHLFITANYTDLMSLKIK